jgi:hypothetical protein
LEAAIGIEPMIKVLQTFALPLGHTAAEKDEGGNRKDETQHSSQSLVFLLHPSSFSFTSLSKAVS